MSNPALSDVASLVGEWRIQLSDAEFLAVGASMWGTMSVGWLDEAFLVVRSSFVEACPPASTLVIGRNESRSDYEVLYFDERGTSRIYRMTFDQRRWTQHCEDPGFHQLFVATIDPGLNRITAAWTKSHDEGKSWQHDFDLTYTRL